MMPLLEELAASVCAARTLEELTRPLLEMLEAVTGLESTYLTRIDGTLGTQQVLYARNTRALDIPEGLVVPWQDTLCKRALDEGQSYTCDVPAQWGDSEAARALGIQTYASVPVRVGDTLYGTLCAASAQSHPLAGQAAHVLQLFAALIGHQLERELLVQQLVDANHRLATTAATDQLTGLPNRRALIEALHRMLAQGRRRGTSVLVAFIDLDDFKTINDTHGHAVGDAFLAEIARRLKTVLRAEDFVARYGGDEFIVIGPAGSADEPHPEVAEQALAQRIGDATTGPIEAAGTTLDYAGPSVGVVSVQPQSGLDVEGALRVADATMYQVKLLRRERRHTA